jgi:hypothetical protein
MGAALPQVVLLLFLLVASLARRLQGSLVADCECVMMKRFWLILAMFLGLASTAVPASADIQWTLGCSDSPCTGSNANHNYGTVTAVQIGTGVNAKVEVTIKLAANNYLLATGSHIGIAWDMSIIPGAITVLTQDPPPVGVVHSDASKFTTQALNGSYDDQPFTSGQNGNFNYAITPTASGGGAATETSIVFDLTKAGGLTLSNTLFGHNAGGYYWAVDIGYNCVVPAGKSERKCASTGVVAANSYVNVPEPGTWTMSIAGLAGLTGLMALRRRRKLVRA